MTDVVPVAFTIDELWLLQSVVRHEIQQQELWKFPPASRELNDQIAAALVACEDCNFREYRLLLSRGDCLVIDYLVPQNAASLSGQKIGRVVLMKSFRARQALDEPVPTAEEPAGQPSATEIQEWMTRWDKKGGS